MAKKIKLLGLLTVILLFVAVMVLSYSQPTRAQTTGSSAATSTTTAAQCQESNYQDYANCPATFVPDFNDAACLRVLPPCFKCGNCQLDDFVWLFVNLGTWGIRILPVAALLFLMWGGFILLTSGGNTSKIEEGKKMIASVLIGVIIVLVVAWTMTSLIIWMLTGDVKANIFGRPWYGEGSSTTGTVPSDKGCCIQTITCDQTTQDQCKTLNGSWQQGKTCIPDFTICQNFLTATSCCVPKDPTDKTKECEPPQPDNTCSSIDYILTPKNCLNIEQCYNGATEANPGCCVSDRTCEKPTGLGTCSTSEFSFRSDSCDTISSCKGCCYNGANPAPDKCQNDVLSYDCATGWAHGACTAAMCGQTCCSYECGAATPNVTNCTAVHSDQANGECNSFQLETGCGQQFSGSDCTDNMNFYFCEQNNYFYCKPNVKCSEQTDTTCPHIYDCK